MEKQPGKSREQRDTASGNGQPAAHHARQETMPVKRRPDAKQFDPASQPGTPEAESARRMRESIFVNHYLTVVRGNKK